MRFGAPSSREVSLVGRFLSFHVVAPLAGLVALLLVAGCQGADSVAPRLSPTGPAPTLASGSGTNIIPPGNPGFPNSGDARALNASGQVTGAFFFSTAQDFQPYRWSAVDGLTPITGCCDTRYGLDINDAGVVVGSSQAGNLQAPRGFVATGTTMTILSTLPGSDPDANTRAVAINNAGQIVGTGALTFSTSHAVLWSAAGVIQDLGTLGGTHSSGIDINASGQVIGSSETSGNAATHYFVWSSATGMQDLNTLTGAAIADVVAINDAGQIAGTYLTSGGQAHAFLYTPGSALRDLGTLGGTGSAATGLNNNGLVVGSSTLANGATHAFLWTPTDGMEDITNVTGATEVRGLNDNLQTLTGTVAPTLNPSLQNPLPKLIQLTVTPGGNHPPTASFTANCVGQSSPTQCAFDASGSTDDVGILSYKWDWGNGRSETKVAPTSRNTWSSAGVYTVTLTVTDAGGLVGISSQRVAVGNPPNQLPKATITNPAANTTFAQGSPVTLLGSASDVEDGQLTGASLTWSSTTDGVLGTGSSLTVSNLSVGGHFIILTATDSKGATGRAGINITITAPPANQPPTASFTYVCGGGTNPRQCAFDASGSTDDAGIVSYKWDWGNGRTETKSGPTTRNTWASGTYTVTLTVTDAGNLSSSTSQQVVVP